MKLQNPNRIAELRLAKRWNQRELADALGVHYMTVSKLERGGMRLTQDWMERLGQALEVDPAELISDSSLVRSVYINGIIGDDIDLLSAQDPPNDEDLLSTKFRIDFGTTPPQVSFFFFVSTQSYQPLMHSGDVARFTSVSLEHVASEALFGRLCILEIDDPKAMLIGVAERGREPHLLDLRLPTGGHRRGLRANRVYVLTLVVGLPEFQIGDDNAPL